MTTRPNPNGRSLTHPSSSQTGCTATIRTIAASWAAVTAFSTR